MASQKTPFLKSHVCNFCASIHFLSPRVKYFYPTSTVAHIVCTPLFSISLSSLPSTKARDNDLVNMANNAPWKYLNVHLFNGVRLAYIDCPVPPETKPKGTVLLLHGFPQTSYQFRHVIPLFASAGYRVIAPDYRGAGNSSRPHIDYTKTVMAGDILVLLDHAGVSEAIHVIGHDIGGMVAYALASRWPERFRTLCFGECPIPGTRSFYRDREENAVEQFHFIFHCVGDLPEALVEGKERIYLQHFFNKLTYNVGAFTREDINYYVEAYSQPGAMRCAFELYRAFDKDAEDNREWMQSNGKCEIPALILSGDHSRHKNDAEEMALEVRDPQFLEIGEVQEAGHYVAEENPEGFAAVVIGFISRHDD